MREYYIYSLFLVFIIYLANEDAPSDKQLKSSNLSRTNLASIRVQLNSFRTQTQHLLEGVGFQIKQMVTLQGQIVSTFLPIRSHGKQ